MLNFITKISAPLGLEILDKIGMVYEFLEHPSDLKIRAYGNDLSEVFNNMMIAMFDFLSGGEICKENEEEGAFLRQEVSRKIEIESPDSETLLVDFLSECLTLSDTYSELYNKVNFLELLDNYLEAEVWGYSTFRRVADIKAVTHHDLEIKKDETSGIWQATVLFDI